MHTDPAVLEPLLPVRLQSLQFPGPLYHDRPADLPDNQQEADDLSQLQRRFVACRPTARRRDTVILRRSCKHVSVGKDCLQEPVASTLGAQLAEGKEKTKTRRLTNNRLSLTAQVQRRNSHPQHKTLLCENVCVDEQRSDWSARRAQFT